MDSSHVLRFLPDVFRRTMEPSSPLDGLVQAMVSLLDPVDQRLLQLDRYFDPYRAPTAMLPYLATWVDLGWLAVRERDDGEGLPPARLRRLIANAPAFAKQRGTARGLEAMLRIATEVEEIRVKDASVDAAITRPFHIVVELPRSAAENLRLVELIVQFEKPIHLTHEVTLVG